jgi:hypothetical protein
MMCTKAVHLNCLLRQFKDAGNSPLKNNIDWLRDFIQFSSLLYRCGACVSSNNTVRAATVDVPSLPNNALGDLHSQIKNVGQRVDDLLDKQNDLLRKLSSFEPLASVVCVEASSPNSSSFLACDQKEACAKDSNVASSSACKPMSYSAAVSNNLSDVVKSVIVTTLQQQKDEERDKASVVIHNLPEHGTDARDVQELLDFLECRMRISSTVRIGRAMKSSKKPRLLKVVLSSAADRTRLLQVVKYLKDDRSTSSIFITKWLQPGELSLLRENQKRCRFLNDSAPPLKNGKRPYIVLSGKLMQRLEDGSLRPVPKISVSNNATHSGIDSLPPAGVASSSKNGAGGSHAAP